jgi:hypothetical protein
VRVPRQIPFELGAPGTAPEPVLPVVLTVDDADSTRDVIDALALAPFVAGHQPYATVKNLDHVRRGATLAELYALRDGDATAVERRPVLHGQYL